MSETYELVTAEQATEDAISDVEIIKPTEQQYALLRTIANEWSQLPIHEEALLSFEPEMQEILIDCYDGTVARSWKSMLGRTETVLGMRIYQHGPYNGKDGKYHEEGYFQIQILLSREDEEGNPIVIKSSSIGLLYHVVHIIKNRGWYLFDVPQQYQFGTNDNNGHILKNVTPGRVRLSGKIVLNG